MEARLKENQQPKAANSIYQALLEEYPEEEDFQLKMLAYYSMFLYTVDEFEEAKQHLLAINKRAKKMTPLIAKANITLGNIYALQSKSILAATTFSKNKIFWEQSHRTRHPDYALCLNDYGLFLLRQGNLQASEKLILQSEKINERYCTIKSIRGFNLNAKGNINLESGNLEEAKFYFNAATKLYENLKLYKKSAFNLFMLGRINFQAKAYKSANFYFQKALSFLNRFSFSGEDLLKGHIFQELADISSQNWEDKKADSLYLVAIDIFKKKLGAQNIDYSTAISNLAYSKEYQQQFDTALVLYKQVENLDTLLLGFQHSEYLTTLYNIARCYTYMDSTKLADNYFAKANELQLFLLENYFTGFDEDTRWQYRLDAMANFDNYYIYACKKNNP